MRTTDGSSGHSRAVGGTGTPLTRSGHDGLKRLPGADVLRGALKRTAQMPTSSNMAVLAGFCAALFIISLGKVSRTWIC